MGFNGNVDFSFYSEFGTPNVLFDVLDRIDLAFPVLFVGLIIRIRIVRSVYVSFYEFYDTWNERESFLFDYV